jgi:hypothetical protein
MLMPSWECLSPGITQIWVTEKEWDEAPDTPQLHRLGMWAFYTVFPCDRYGVFWGEAQLGAIGGIFVRLLVLLS